MWLNKEKMMEFIKDKDIQVVVNSPTFVKIRGKFVPTTMLLPNDYLESWINMVCNFAEQDGIPWQQVLFHVHHSGNTMFLDVNATTMLH